MMNARQIVVGLLGLVVGLGTGEQVMAQYQLGNGQRLDNSLQVGSRGLNSAKVQNTHGNAQNALVTGNVGGLGNFRGNIDYRAPGEFTGVNSGDLVFEFDRASAGRGLWSNQQQATGGLNRYGGYDPTQGYAIPQVLARPGSGATGGTISGYGDYIATNSAFRADAAGGQFEQDKAQLRSSESAAEQYRVQQRSISGYEVGGQKLRVQAQQDLRLNRFLPTLNDVSAAHASFAQQREQHRVVSGIRPVAIDQPEFVGDGDEYEIEETVSQRFARGDQQPSTTMLSLGQRLGNELRVTETYGISDSTRASTRELDQSLDLILGSRSVEPGTDVYMDILRHVRGEDEEERAVPLNQLGAAKPVDPNAPVQSTDPSDPFAVPDYNAIAVQRGALEGGVAEEGAGTAPVDTGASDSINEVIERLDYDMKPLESFTGNTESFLDSALAKAEKHMASRRYFDADNAYSEALVYKPGHPLALAGRANAQIGAGLSATAARSLYRLLSQHPELIATRYAEPILPPADRLETVRDRLLTQLLDEDAPADAALLLAYISYQQGDNDTCVRGLDEWESRKPNDTLTPLLRRIWVNSPAEPTSSTPASP